MEAKQPIQTILDSLTDTERADLLAVLSPMPKVKRRSGRSRRGSKKNHSVAWKPSATSEWYQEPVKEDIDIYWCSLCSLEDHQRLPHDEAYNHCRKSHPHHQAVWRWPLTVKVTIIGRGVKGKNKPINSILDAIQKLDLHAPENAELRRMVYGDS